MTEVSLFWFYLCEYMLRQKILTSIHTYFHPPKHTHTHTRHKMLQNTLIPTRYEHVEPVSGNSFIFRTLKHDRAKRKKRNPGKNLDSAVSFLSVAFHTPQCSVYECVCVCVCLQLLVLFGDSDTQSYKGKKSQEERERRGEKSFSLGDPGKKSGSPKVFATQSLQFSLSGAKFSTRSSSFCVLLFARKFANKFCSYKIPLAELNLGVLNK